MHPFVANIGWYAAPRLLVGSETSSWPNSWLSIRRSNHSAGRVGGEIWVHGVSELPATSDDTRWTKILTVMLGCELENDLESLVRGFRNKKTKNKQKEK